MGSVPGMRKAAVLLMSLPTEEAAKLMAKLQPKQMEAVSIEIAKLGRLASDEQEQVITEFAESNPASLGGERGGVDTAQALLEKALGENAKDTVETVRRSLESIPFGFLKGVDPTNLMTFISDEHPQTIALILSHLAPGASAEVLAGLESKNQLAVIRRIANMGQTNPEVIKEVEGALESRMANVMSQSFQNAGGVPSVAGILNVTDRTTGRAIMDQLTGDDPDLVEEIRRLMFVFDDLTKISDKDIQSVLKNVESAQWTLALKGASAEVKQKILGNMSTRAADMLREEMEYLGPVKLSDVESMQQQIVDVIRRLEDSGDLALNAGDDTDQFIE